MEEAQIWAMRILPFVGADLIGGIARAENF